MGSFSRRSSSIPTCGWPDPNWGARERPDVVPRPEPPERLARECQLADESDALQAVAERLGATPMAVALAWLLQRSPNVLLIPGTSSVAHLHENVAGAALQLPGDATAELDAIGR